jgi:autotransporter-associated beta strand protein
MKTRFLHLCICVVFSLSLGHAQQLAFPGAEGFGKYATGGRTGKVYHVTTLNNTGAGSLRDAVSVANRIVVFDVAGVIKITDRIVVASNIYIAGQTAPGEGVTVYGNGFSYSNANNTICRYLRMRMGSSGTSGKDACGIADGHDMIFDHISVSWGRDETFSINAPDALRITIQNSIIAQGLLTHSAGGLIQTNGGVTLYRNFYCDNGTRNNKVKGVNQYVNNIVYNWESGAYIMGGDSEGESFVNTYSNYFIKGPADGVRPLSVGNNKFHMYAIDNILDDDRNGVPNGVEVPYSEYGGGPDIQATPYAYPVLPTVAASTLVDELTPAVGASLPYRDLVDYYVINELKSFGKKGSLITSETELPFGTPSQWSLWAGSKPQDTDNDGMPDAWETANGLNPAVDDAMIISANGYANIENYINSITTSSSQSYLRAPLCMKADSAKQTEIYLSWFDYTEKEQGYIIERKVNGTFVEIARTGVNKSSFTVTGMSADETGIFRVKAYNANSASGYSNELTAKTKPLPIVVIDPVSFAPAVTWSGASSLNWDKATNNWTGASSVFTDASNVLFKDIPSGSQVINKSETVAPKDIVVLSASDYTFQGAGAISGTSSMNKAGTGKLALLTDNSYTGTTVLWDGTLEINKLANGELPSSIGASKEYNINWVLKGGKVLYTGPTTSTNRSIALDGTSEFSVNDAAATVTISGSIAGSGGLIKSGPGRLLLTSVNPYLGETVIKGGTLELAGTTVIDGGAGIGTSNVLKLQGGNYVTSGGSNTINELYPMDIVVAEGTTNGFAPYRNCYIKSKVSGSGTLNYSISYSRELIQGDWSQFSGTLIANGVGLLTGAERPMLMMNNTVGIPNARIVTAGTTKIVSYNNQATMYLGGLSGPAGTVLACADKTNTGATMTWIVGGMGTDETFNGIINNECFSSGSGSTTIVKEGTGIWRLTGANIYTGTTTVNDGTLIVNGAHTGTGKITVTEGGVLAGTGSLKGTVEIQSGAFLQPGDNSIGAFTVGPLNLLSGSTVQMSIDKTATVKSDKVTSTGAIVYNGLLDLTIAGALAIGDQYTLFAGTSMSGSFTQIKPARPATGLKWVFANGVLSVAASTSKPDVVINPFPANTSTNADTLVPVSWALNPDADTYSVYMGTDPNNLTLVSSLQTTASYIPVGLTANTTYYWRVDCANNFGITTGTVWSFTSKPPVPKVVINPSPANAATSVELNVDATWKSGLETTSCQVYFGTDPANLVLKSASVTNGTYNFSGLTNDTKYYWRINTVNAGAVTTGNVWSFTTKVPVPSVPTVPVPALGAEGADTVSLTLTWTRGNYATTHTVYLGTALNNLTAVAVNISANSFTVPALKGSTLYFWRVVSENTTGTATGAMWSFFTKTPLPKVAVSPAPANTAINIDSTQCYLSWLNGTSTNLSSVYFGTDPNNLSLVVADIDVTAIQVKGLTATTTYYWRVDGKNTLGTTTGNVWSFTTRGKTIATGIGELSEKTVVFYPNPFTDRLSIALNVPTSGNVSVEITNLAGKVVKVLTKGPLLAGRYTFSWDGSGNGGASLGGGIYLLVIRNSKGSEVYKISYLKL